MKQEGLIDLCHDLLGKTAESLYETYLVNRPGLVHHNLGT